MSAKTGRNDPCPCGSGKKYKRCCLATDTGAELGRVRLRRVEGRLVAKVLEYALERYGEDLLDVAWDEFWCWEPPEEIPQDTPDFATIFLPWFLFNWVPDADDPERPPDADWPDTTLALDWLERGGAPADELEERFVEEAGRRPFSFYEVARVDPGRALALRDVLTGEEWTVAERSGTGTIRAGGVLFARALALDETAILFGCAPLLLPPRHLPGLIDLREEIAGEGRWLDDEDVAEYDIEIREAYLDIADRILDPRPPELRNTDGDPLALTTLRFDLHVPPEEALAKLASLSGEEPSAILEHAVRDDSGAVESLLFDWVREGNPRHKGMDNTILANVEIGRGSLVGRVNSNRRAEALRAEVESRLGEGASFRHATIESPEKLLEERAGRPETARERRSREESDRLMALPEVQARLREMAERHWEGWVDEKIPALGGATPREAAATPAGRERLEALLRSFEWPEGDRPGDELQRPNVEKLRRRLGLE